MANARSQLTGIANAVDHPPINQRLARAVYSIEETAATSKTRRVAAASGVQRSLPMARQMRNTVGKPALGTRRAS